MQRSNLNKEFWVEVVLIVVHIITLSLSNQT